MDFIGSKNTAWLHGYPGGVFLNIKRWEVKKINKPHVEELMGEYQVPLLMAMLLDIRGYASKKQIEDIVGDDRGLSDPFLMKDMDKAVERIHRAIDNFERIAVYGDYDADGVTSTAMLFSYLEAVGADVRYYIPKRDGEGYGMNIPAVEKLAEDGVQLIITVDNGISAIDEVARAAELGVDVVVTDHHRPREILPRAAAVVDPYRKDCPSEFKDFCGAGIVLKLLIALEEGDPDMVMAEYADLAALGTIGDIVSVTGENRAIIKTGMESIATSQRPGLTALLEKSGCGGKDITVKTLAFTVIPRINATGRMGASERAVHLLTCEDEQEAEDLAEIICAENTRRKDVEKVILDEAIAQIESSPSMRYDRVLVVDGNDWHHGVVGIVAARITEKYGKPTVVISKDGEEARGSGRSIEGFSLFEAVSHCSGLLTKFGGHPMAAGISMDIENVDSFRIEINKYAQDKYYEMPSQVIVLDSKLNPASLSVEMGLAQAHMEPFGTDNPSPLFGLYRMKIDKITPVGGGGHLRLTCSRDGANVTAMCFGQRLESFPYAVGDTVDLAVSMNVNEFRGEMQLTVQVKDIKYTGIDQEINIETYRLYEMFKRRENISKSKLPLIMPTRDELAAVYRYLTAKSGRSNIFTVLSALESADITLGKLLLCLDIFTERGLASCERIDDRIDFSTVKSSGKINIYDSEIFAQIKSLAV